MAETSTMRVELVSPESVVYSGEATMVVTRTEGGGDIAFLPGHAPFLGALAAGVTRVFLAGGGELRVAVHGGFVEISNNRVSILSDEAELATDIDVAQARADKAAAEERLRSAPDDPQALAQLRRADVRLLAAEGAHAGH